MKQWVKKSLVLAAAAVLLGCNLPFAGLKPGADEPAPNLTMTALFGSGLLGSLTPAAPVEFPTLAPTEEEEPLAATPTVTMVPLTATPELAATPTPPGLPTAPPTLTAGPATATLAGRPGGAFSAAYFASPPTLDGNWDEWPGKTYAAAAVVYGQRETSADLESSFRVGWDYQYLYVAAKVRDDRYAQNASGADLYKGDSLEILLDSNLWDDFGSAQLSGDDFQLGISAGRGGVDGTREAYLWFPSGLAGGQSKVKIGAAAFEEGYRVEAAVPWSVFGVTPGPGVKVGFAFSVSDNDNVDQNVQQTMVSGTAGRKLTNPTTWGVLTLQ